MQEITPLLLLGFFFVANSLWIMGFWLLFEDGFLLWRVGEWLEVTPLVRGEAKRLRELQVRNTELMQALKAPDLDYCLDEHVPLEVERQDVLAQMQYIQKNGDRYYRVSPFIRKPLYACPFCMSSVHGSAWYLIADLGPWYYLPVYCVALCGAIVVMMWGRVE